MRFGVIVRHFHACVTFWPILDNLHMCGTKRWALQLGGFNLKWSWLAHQISYAGSQAFFYQRRHSFFLPSPHQRQRPQRLHRLAGPPRPPARPPRAAACWPRATQSPRTSERSKALLTMALLAIGLYLLWLCLLWTYLGAE